MRLTPTTLTLACLMACGAAQADTGKLLLTGGVSTVEGAAGGGLTPWAVIGSNASAGETGFSAFASRANTQDYGLTVVGAAVGIHDRYELSLAKQDFNTGLRLIAEAVLQSPFFLYRTELGNPANAAAATTSLNVEPGAY